MAPLLTKAKFTGRVETLLSGADRELGLEKAPVQKIFCSFAGIEGDFHGGLTRKSDSRTLQQYPRNTDIRNVRQLTLLSVEELGDIAASLGIDRLMPEWLGANLVTSGIPDLTLLPPSTRLQFPSGCTIVVDMENAPCRQVADVIARTYPEQASRFIAAATHKRGVTAWVEREGFIHADDEIIAWLPPQRLYGHG